MSDLNDKRLDDALRRVEFPGEDPSWIVRYLEERHFVERVMKAVAEVHIRMSRASVWAIVGGLNLALLVVVWLNPFLLEDLLALRRELLSFVLGFLGLTLAGCITGIILSVDARRVEDFLHHLFRHNSG